MLKTASLKTKIALVAGAVAVCVVVCTGYAVADGMRQADIQE